MNAKDGTAKYPEFRGLRYHFRRFIPFPAGNRYSYPVASEYQAWISAFRRYVGAWPQEAAKYFETEWGLSSAFAPKAALLYAALSLLGLNPRITSGFRDPAKQRDLIRRWNAGERAGFIGKPANPDTSRHCRETLFGGPASDAIDMPCSNTKLADNIARAIGLRAGSDFSDPGHYDMG